MLETLRKGADSWIAKFLLAILVASFAIWGIGDVLRGSSNQTVAQVGDARITQTDFAREFRARLNTLSQRGGGDISVAQAVSLGFDQMVAQQMINRAALDETVRALNLGAPNQAVADFIRRSDAFKGISGQFDRDIYGRVLQMNGLNEKEFEANVRADLAREQMLGVIRGGASVPQTTARLLWLWQNQTRDITAFKLGIQSTDTLPQPADGELKKLYDEKIDRFTAPEYRSIAVLNLNAAALADPAAVDPAEVRKLYDSRAAQYKVPERRNLDQIIYPDQAAADAAYARLRDGDSFERLADERKLTPRDVALGFVAASELPEAVAKAAFAPPVPGPVPPVQVDLGWAVLQIRAIEAARETGFDEVQAELTRELAIKAARDKLAERAEEIDELRAGGLTLEEVAKKFNYALVLATIDKDGFDQNGLKAAGLPDSATFRNKVFSAPQGDDMDMTRTEEGDFFVARIDQIIPSAPRPFDTVETQVRSLWDQARRTELVEQKAKDAIEKLKAGADIFALTGVHGAPLIRGRNIARGGSFDGLSQVVIGAAFNAKPGEFHSVAEPGGREVWVYAVEKITTPDLAKGAGGIELIAAELNEMLAVDLAESFTQGRIKTLGATLNRPAMEAALNLLR